MNKTIYQRLTENYLLGCIKYRDRYSIYLMPIAWWILNYKKYDPAFDSAKWGVEFREGVYNVTDDKVEDYMQSIKDDKIEVDELENFSSPFEFYFFIDFDSKLFVSRFSDIEIEDYLPSSNWRGDFEDPIKYYPKEIKRLVG